MINVRHGEDLILDITLGAVISLVSSFSKCHFFKKIFLSSKDILLLQLNFLKSRYSTIQEQISLF